MAKKSLLNADRWFSIYTRLRDADDEGNILCISCGKEVYWKDCDAGHFIPRQHRSTRYNEKNVHAQCRKCNRFDNGNPAGYAAALVKKYRIKILEDLMVASHGTTKWTQFDIDNLTDFYKQKAWEIAIEKGLTI